MVKHCNVLNSSSFLVPASFLHSYGFGKIAASSYAVASHFSLSSSNTVSYLICVGCLF